MKKLISLLLCAVLMFSVTAVAFAETEKKIPVLFVAGLNTRELVQTGDDGSKTVVFPPASDTISAAIKTGLGNSALSVARFGGWDGLASAICGAVMDVFEPILMNPDTTPKHNVSIEQTESDSTSVEIYNRGEDYFFTYDWRLSPLDIAPQLNERIEAILAATGCDKIVLYSHSMGGTVVMSYLEQYGDSRVERLLFANSAFQGMDFVGDLFTGKIELDADILTTYLNDLLYGTDAEWVTYLLNALNALNITDGLCKFSNDVLIEKMQDTVVKEIHDFVYLLPSLWAFCPLEDYEEAKLCAFGSTPDSKYSVLIDKNDYYKYKVQSKVKPLLDAALSHGVEVAIVCSYNYNVIPLVPSANQQADTMIDVKFASAGAYCANIGKTLPEGYTQEVADGHNHISADRVIDASTCLYPQYTWFIKNIKHSDLTAEIDGFYDWIINFDGQPTVSSNSSYPQFLINNSETNELLPLTVDENVEQPFLDRVLEWINAFFAMFFKIVIK